MFYKKKVIAGIQITQKNLEFTVDSSASQGMKN